MPRISSSARRALTEERRKQILNAAAKVFADKGFERATIADIAREAGMAEGSIYNYFKNKEDLLVSIPRQMLELPVESVSTKMAMAATAIPPTPDQMLTTVARNIIAAVRQNAHIFRILVSALPTMQQSMREKYVNQVVVYAFGVLEAYFQQQIEQGVFHKDLSPKILVRAFVGMLFPFVMLGEVLQVESESDWDYDQVIAMAVPIFLRGVMTEEAGTSRDTQRARKIPVE